MHAHDHTHFHGHAHGDGPPRYRGRLLASIALNLAISVAELIGGILSGSLALLSDALHNFSDTASLGISYAAGVVASRQATHAKTFGYRRAEIIGAFVNLVTLVLIAVWLLVEAGERFFNPPEIEGGIMLWVAVGGLAGNVLTAVLLHRGSRENLNLRSAFLHIVSDGVSSVVVVGGGVLILLYDIRIIDPILTAAIAGFILFQSVGLMRQTIDILMEAAPGHLHVPEIAAEVQRIDGVVEMHHVHVWQLDERRAALEAHVVIRKHDLEQMEAIKQEVKTLLHDRFEIAHTTLEFEFEPCAPGTPDCFERGRQHASHGHALDG